MAKKGMTIQPELKTTMTIAEASAYSNIGSNKLYQMTKDPRCCSFVLFVGNKRLIKRKEFENYLSKHTYI